MCKVCEEGSEEECPAKRLADQERKRRGLPKDTPIPLLYLCPCEKCRKRIIC